MKHLYEYGLNYSKVKTLYLKEGLKFWKLSSKRKVQLYKFSFYENLSVSKEASLKKIHDNIMNLISMESYRGYRHVIGLPVNGQNTHNNRKTQRSLSKKRILK